MSEYIFLLRGGDSRYKALSPEEQAKMLQEYRDWAEQLRSQECLIEATKLESDGRKLIRKSGGLEVDGPFTETHETIGGYYLIQAESMQEAVSVAQSCPIFGEGGTVEIREIQY